MSVEGVEHKDRSVVWRVRWRQGGRNRRRCSVGSATPMPSTPSWYVRSAS